MTRLSRGAMVITASVTFIDVPSVGSRQYWTRELPPLRSVPRVGEEVSVPGASTLRIGRVIWEFEKSTVSLVLEECPRELIERVQSLFWHDEPDEVQRFISDGSLTELMEGDGWSLRGPRTSEP